MDAVLRHPIYLYRTVPVPVDLPVKFDKREPCDVLPVQGSVVAIWLERTTAVATLSFGGRDRRSVVANGAKANDALFAVCRVLRPSQGRLSGFTTEKF